MESNSNSRASLSSHSWVRLGRQVWGKDKVAGGIPPALNNLRVWIRAGRLEPLGIIVVTFLALGAAASLISGSVFFALVKESILTGAFGLICLSSLLARRPLLFYIIRQFAAGDDPARIEWWNGLWQYPRFRFRMRVVTAAWGLVYLVEACLRVVFALTLTPGQTVARAVAGVLGEKVGPWVVLVGVLVILYFGFGSGGSSPRRS